jgi:hypothetical protein
MGEIGRNGRGAMHGNGVAFLRRCRADHDGRREHKRKRETHEGASAYAAKI